MRTTSKFIAAGLIAISAPLLAGAAVAAPLNGPRALSSAEGAAAPLQTVQFRRGWRGGWHRGWRGGRWIGPAAGFAAGAVIGSALASPYYDGYAYGPAYAYEPYVAVSPPAVVARGGDDAYCSQRYRSYDPSSGTYLGYDGHRHPCP